MTPSPPQSAALTEVKLNRTPASSRSRAPPASGALPLQGILHRSNGSARGFSNLDVRIDDSASRHKRLPAPLNGKLAAGVSPLVMIIWKTRLDYLKGGQAGGCLTERAVSDMKFHVGKIQPVKKTMFVLVAVKTLS